MYTAFKQYLTTLKLSPVSRKLYLSDIRRYLSYLGDHPTLSQVTSSYPKYFDHLRSEAMAPSMLKRTTASLRQFGTFLSLTYSLPNPFLPSQLPTPNSQLPRDQYIKHFINYLSQEHLSPLTIKSYKSDVTRYLDWCSSSKMTQVISDKNVKLYLNHLANSGPNLVSTIERKSQSLARFQAWYNQNYKPDNTPTPNYQLPSLSDSPTPNSQIPTTISSPDLSPFFVKNFNYRNVRNSSAISTLLGRLNPTNSRFITSRILTFAILLLFTAGLAIFGYRQFSQDVRLTAAYPSTPVTPNRQLSFQGRLENAAGTPITVATNLTFKLFTASSGGTELYSSGACSLTPDTDGVFNTQIGDTCGGAIASSVFTENQDVWLEVTVVAETLTPRQQIATVAYALNSETLQGFPLSSTVSAIKNTVVPMNQWGEILIGEQSPRMTGISGTFAISAPALSLTTTTGTNGNITLAPDGTGQVNLNGNTTDTNFFNVANAQLTTGSLITGTAANNNTGFKLIDLLSGSSPTSKFSVTDAGNATFAGDLTITGGNITSATTFDSSLTVTGTTTNNGIVNLGDGGDAITVNGASVGIQTTGAGSDITLDAVDQIILTDFTTCTALETTGGVLTCGTDDAGGAGSSNWRSSLGALSPINDTWDLLVGGIATSSAKAGFININLGTPTATVSAGVAGGSFLTASGYLSTTARQSLTLGNSASYNTSGDILLHPNGTGNVGIGVTNPTSKLEIGGTTSTISNSSGDLTINSFTGNVVFATDDDLIPTLGAGSANLGSAALPWDNLYTGAAYFAGGTTYYVDASGNAKFLDLQVADTGNPGLTVGDGALGFVKIGGSTISDNNGDLTLDSDSTQTTISDDLAISGGNITTATTFDSTLTVTGTSTLNGLTTVNDDLTVALTGNENLEITDGATPTTDTLSIVSNGATITADANALEIDFTTGDGTDVTNSGLQIDLASGGTAATDIINAINLTMDTGDASTQKGINFADNNFDLDLNALTDLTVGIGGTGETILTASAFSPATTDSNALGTSSLFWSDLFLALGGVINFNSDVTLTHAADSLTLAGGVTTLTGSADGTDSLVLTAGDITITNGDLDISDGDFNVDLDAGDGINITKGAAPTVDMFTINSGISATSGVDAFQITYDSANASGNAIDITFSPLQGNGSDTTIGIDLNAFSYTSSAGTDIVQGINLGTLTESGTITSTALNFGTGWDTLIGGTTTTTNILGFTNTTLTSAGALTLAGSLTLSPFSIFPASTSILRISGTQATNNLQLYDGTNDYLFDLYSGANNNVRIMANGASWLNGGNVGIGDATPTEATLVVGNAGAGNIYATFATASAERLCWDAAGASLITDCTGTPGDYAEQYGTVDSSIEAGDIVVVDTNKPSAEVVIDGEKGSKSWIMKSSSTYQSNVIGVISTNPNETIGENFDDSENPRPVALNGRLPVKISSNSVPIHIGDPITSSSDAGKGMKATNAGKIVGIALQDWDPSNPTKTILLFVNNSYYNPDLAINNAGDVTLNGVSLVDYSVSISNGVTDKIAAFAATTIAKLTAGFTQTNELAVTTISPLSPNQPITVTGPVQIKPPTTNYQLPDTPILIVDGELSAATISARVAILQNIQAENITARSIVADTISANHIEGLDAKLATLSASLTDSELTSITDRIKSRLEALTGNLPDAGDLPIPPEATPSASMPTTNYQIPNTASDSATLSSLDLDFVTINNYLAVIGSATITDLEVTGRLYTQNITSKTGLLALGDNTLIIDDQGSVTINGNLTVSGQILADSAQLNSLSLGSSNLANEPNSANSSELGKLLSIYNEAGIAVATIDASGSANLASLTTNMITIASSGDATSSSLLSTNIATNATAGESTLIAPNTELIIESPFVTPNSLVYLTPTGNTDNKVVFVKSKNTCTPPSSPNLANEPNSANLCVPSFTVAIDAPASSDISFNWWIIELKP